MKIEEHQIPLLIKEGKAQDAISFLYKTVFPQVKRYITKNNGTKDDALDAFQEAMVSFYNAVLSNRFESEKNNVCGFVYRISINHWLNKVRKDKRIQFQEEMVKYESVEELEAPILKEEENVIRSMFGKIGEKCVELLTCTIFYDMMMEDVAIRLNYPSVSAAAMQQQRCKQKLIQEIEKDPSLLHKIKGL